MLSSTLFAWKHATTGVHLLEPSLHACTPYMWSQQAISCSKPGTAGFPYNEGTTCHAIDAERLLCSMSPTLRLPDVHYWAGEPLPSQLRSRAL